MRIAVLTDSTAYIPESLREKHNIYVVPLNVIFNDVSYREEIDISNEEFYRKVKEEEHLPTTSQPSIGDISNKLQKLAKDYDAVISIHLSKKISGTFNSVKSVAQMIEGLDVYPYDTELSAMPQGFFALEAASLIKQNKSPNEIIAHLDQLKEKTRAYFMVDDLSHLQRGGRIGNTQALFGGLLKIKPILHLKDGVIEPYEKIRTRKKAINRIMSMLHEDAEKRIVKKVVFIHGNNEQSVLELRDSFSEQYPSIETIISYFGPIIGTHLGENSIGVSWHTS